MLLLCLVLKKGLGKFGVLFSSSINASVEGAPLIDHIALVILSRKGLLARRPGDVLVFDHMLQLTLHRNDKEHDEVHDQNGPEYGHVEHFKQGA